MITVVSPGTTGKTESRNATVKMTSRNHQLDETLSIQSVTSLMMLATMVPRRYPSESATTALRSGRPMQRRDPRIDRGAFTDVCAATVCARCAGDCVEHSCSCIDHLSSNNIGNLVPSQSDPGRSIGRTFDIAGHRSLDSSLWGGSMSVTGIHAPNIIARSLWGAIVPRRIGTYGAPTAA